MKPRKITAQPVKQFLPYLWAYKKEMILALFCGVVGGTTAVMMTYYIGKSVDTMVGKGKVDFSALFHILFLFGGVLVATVISQWLVQVLGNRMAYRAVAQLRKDAFSRLNRLPLQYFDGTSHGNILSRFTIDLDYVSEACAAIFNNVFSGMTIVVISFVYMILLSPLLTVVVLIMTPLIFLVSWVVAKNTQNQFAAQQQIAGEISGFVSEVVGNQKIVSAFQYEQRSQQRFESINKRLYDVGQKAQFASSLTNPLSRCIDHLAYIAIGLVGGLLALAGSHSITVGVITSFVIYSTQFSKPFIELSGITTQIQTAIAGLHRIFDLMEQKEEIQDEANAVVLTKAKGKVDFEHVYFSYDPSVPLIQDFTLSVKPGETIAIVGKTGAGKSTLVNLLMRFYEVNKGTILIDDVPIDDYTRDSLRRAFGMVLQDTWLFDGTIWDNLTFGRPDATKEEVIAATKSAKIHSFIKRLPNGYETTLGSDGVKISEGQMQLLTIARTMISNPAMLILDEATSSVDTLTESKIQAAFLAMMKGRTSFVIAHRLATIREADHILVMDQGQVVEIGTHDELLQKIDGYYYRLYHSQFAQE